MNPPIQLDAPPHRPGRLAWVGVVAALMAASALAGAAFSAPATRVEMAPAKLERRYTIVVKAPDGDKNLVCREGKP